MSENASSSTDTTVTSVKRKHSPTSEESPSKRQKDESETESDDSDSVEVALTINTEATGPSLQTAADSPKITSPEATKPAVPEAAKPAAPDATKLTEYTCPICFTPPTNATLTPCGHICCGSCLFSAIKIAAARNVGHEFRSMCPVCRAPIPHWDGKGGGVIGLKPKVTF